MAPVKLKYW